MEELKSQGQKCTAWDILYNQKTTKLSKSNRCMANTDQREDMSIKKNND